MGTWFRFSYGCTQTITWVSIRFNSFTNEFIGQLEMSFTRFNSVDKFSIASLQETWHLTPLHRPYVFR